jgi:Na+/melibiose symporter-like transporter
MQRTIDFPTKKKQITDFVPSALKDSNFLMFILYFSVWTFAVNLSAPFFNIYLLKNLSLDVSLVTIYSSLSSGANLLLLMFWGRLADRWGNRPLLIAVGLVVVVTPLLWLGTNSRLRCGCGCRCCTCWGNDFRGDRAVY